MSRASAENEVSFSCFLRCYVISFLTLILALTIATVCLFYLPISGGSPVIGGGNVTFEEVKALKDNATVLLIDVRQPEELAKTGVIPGSINIPLDILEDTLRDLPPTQFFDKYQREKPNFDTILVFSCQAGGRSARAQRLAVKLGFIKSKNYPGGWREWESKTKKLLK